MGVWGFFLEKPGKPHSNRLHDDDLLVAKLREFLSQIPQNHFATCPK
jgi:hypothetical protein